MNGSIHRYLLTGLVPDTVVRVSVTATTDGGSTQGPILSIRTRSFGEAHQGPVLATPQLPATVPYQPVGVSPATPSSPCFPAFFL